jgi:DNA polymerase-3 subunit delta'
MAVDAAELGPVTGHDAAKAEWREAVESGRMHHGWLLRGPRGVGKARLALQFAAQLLGAKPASPLAADASDPVGRLIASGSHPDLRVIRRPVDDKGKEKAEIPVDSVRELSSFFALRPAMGGWRVAIIDAVDELNRFGSNAVLKTLEEPPPKAVIFLISHGERALLPTIRSRCRTVRVGALSAEATASVLDQAGMSPGDAKRASGLAPGRPGRAIVLSGADVSAAVDALSRAASKRSGAAELQAAMSAAGKSDLALSAAIDFLRRDVEGRATHEADPQRAAELAGAALDLMRLSQEASGLNQDRAQTAAAAVALVQSVRAF